jgi:GTP-binding protein
MKNANLFVDEADIAVHSGSGGNGVVRFRREKFAANGGPNGGDGGRGGDIILVADTNIGTLLDLKSARIIKAQNGDHGGSSNRKGASGEHVEVRVPLGTLVFDLDKVEDGVELEETPPIADLTQQGQTFTVAKGGHGGLGNARFKTSTRQAPDFALPGKPGESRELRLALKLMADVGLIGFPNAGKSTLLRRISAARPRVANYPFTTLVPSLGVVEREEQRIVVADIPGLIEGASDGAGLGHQFLRHVERTRVLIHLLDLEAMLIEGRDLLSDYDAIRHELGRYRPELLERREIVVLSKGDLIHDESLVTDLLSALSARGIEAKQISAAATQGLDPLLHEAFDAVETAKREEREAEKKAKAQTAEKSGGQINGRNGNQRPA